MTDLGCHQILPSGERCTILPAFRFTWPGKDEARVCYGHAATVLAIGSAIGCYVQMIPLSPAEIAEAEGRQP